MRQETKELRKFVDDARSHIIGSIIEECVSYRPSPVRCRVVAINRYERNVSDLGHLSVLIDTYDPASESWRGESRVFTVHGLRDLINSGSHSINDPVVGLMTWSIIHD